MRATRLAGAGFATYRSLEARIAATEPDWVIEVLPPPLPLPRTIATDAEGLTASGRETLAVIGWAAQRLGQPVQLSGNSDGVNAATELLQRDGIAVQARLSSGPLVAEWGDGTN